VCSGLPPVHGERTKTASKRARGHFDQFPPLRAAPRRYFSRKAFTAGSNRLAPMFCCWSVEKEEEPVPLAPVGLCRHHHGPRYLLDSPTSVTTMRNTHP